MKLGSEADRLEHRDHSRARRILRGIYAAAVAAVGSTGEELQRESRPWYGEEGGWIRSDLRAT